MPEGWETLSFSGIEERTSYALVTERERVVLRADSRMSASALIRRVNVETGRHPYLHWSWKTDAGCFSGSWRDPQTDDFPLRLFVVFERSGGVRGFFRRLGSGLSDSAFSGNAILYVAGAGTAPGAGADVEAETEAETSTHVSGRIRVVPLSYPDRGRRGWGRYTRDVRADYLALFGREAKDVAAVAVMTDTDNSQTECVSYFGDIYFSEAGP